MTIATRWTLAAMITLAAVSVGHGAPPDKSAVKPPATVEEARERAKLLHETMHATLHIVHHEYYREDEALAIPAMTLKRVFREMAKSHKIEMRWLAVDGQVMNTDHKPRDAFEKNAVEALQAGKEAHETVEEGVYRRASAITLANDCLKCHLPNRTSTEDRAAGLVISIPLEKK